jgi:hypothetical protein
MNKIRAFPVIALILFFVFACTIPSSVEVKGSPSLKFAANMDFNDFFSDMLDDVFNSGDDEVQILNCTHSSLGYKTFLLRMEIYRDDDYNCEVEESHFLIDGADGYIFINGVEIHVEVNGHGSDKKFTVLDSDYVIAFSDEPQTVSFTGFEDYLEGFGFTEISSKMYVSGTQLASALSIKLSQVDSEGNEISVMSNGKITSIQESGVEFLEEYTGRELPAGGKNIEISDIINSNVDLSMVYEIYLQKDSEINFEWMEGTQVIVAELVIWLPMKLESIEDDAVFKFPDFFDGIGDVFKSLAETGLVENMSIKIGMHPLNPFGNGIFVIKDELYAPIQTPLNKDSFSINLKEEDVDYINNNPFNPVFFILYPQKNTILGIPNGDIMITTVSVGASFKYNVEF